MLSTFQLFGGLIGWAVYVILFMQPCVDFHAYYKLIIRFDIFCADINTYYRDDFSY